MLSLDGYGNLWDNPLWDKCEVCGQPDNCGDCNHKQLSEGDVLDLGGIPAKQLKELFAVKTD